MGRFSRRIVVELTERDYARLLQAGERHRRSPQHQAGVFIEDALTRDEAWPEPMKQPQTATATDLRLPIDALRNDPYATLQAASDATREENKHGPPTRTQDAVSEGAGSINEHGDHVERFPLNGDPYVALQAASEPTRESAHIPSEPSVWPSFRNETPTSNQPAADQADRTESDAPAWGVDTATDDTPHTAEQAETNPPGGVSDEAPKRTARSRR